MGNIAFYEGLNQIIDEIKLYKYNIYAEKHFSFGTWTSRQHAFMKITCRGINGWGENIMAVNNPDISLKEWGECFNELKELTVKDAFAHIRRSLSAWGDRHSEMAEMALVDLAGKMLDKPAAELLELEDKEPVYGVYVILSDNADYVKEKANWAVTNRRDRYIKVKLFGDLELDSSVVKAVRSEAGDRTFLIGDVNGGYRKKGSTTPIVKIAESLKMLNSLGLNACEDPAYITNEEWVELQGKVDNLSLLPDYPMRPAREAVRTIKEGMGRIYNIHPGCTASIIDAVRLANRVKEMGAKLMIGDDSLVGPGCTIWQQLAIGLGADWVEAVEKEKESDDFLNAVVSIATTMDNEGRISVKDDIKGFGIEMSDEKLVHSAVEIITI